jgi:nucleoside-diphosphate-sugar epimerase
MILITGDAGFIGSRLSRRLQVEGYPLRGLDKNSLRSGSEYTRIVGDILDAGAVRRAMEGVDCVIHLAAEHRDFGVSPSRYSLVNEDGTKGLLACASDFNVKKFIFFSSVSVYGDQHNANEESPPKPAGPYGASKLAAERAVQEWTRLDPSREGIILRPTVVFGPNNRANIFKLIKYVCDRKFVWVGDGNAVKSLAYVENVVEATLFLMSRMKPGVGTFNYLDEPQLTTRELVEMISRAAGIPCPRFSVPLRLAIAGARLLDGVGFLTNHDFPVSAARIKKFTTPTMYASGKIRALGFQAPFAIEAGIAANVAWYMDEVRLKKPGSFESSEL